ncbi:vasodilator stimulated phospho :sprouty isoform 1 [Schistosoma japonicum]|uniref:Vasodilator stimulated phospho:sprouty isoform 1 n=1 Tax=Schistosoma japonicum TaxID=6182 RepID=A0A4Z2DSR9_SCHJA|nr:vasodilator stimulated phospho :sprouty isoform 1 [Schistosoma japonicum]
MRSENQVHVFRDLMRCVDKLKKKMSNLENCKRLENKMKNKISDMRLLHSLSEVRLCKRLLADETSSRILQKNGNSFTQEDRLILRLKSSRPVSTFIKSFRDQHEDWISLVHYMLYKNVSGKWKSREQKRRNRKVHGSLPLPPVPPVQTAEVGILDDQSSNSSSYRVLTMCAESDSCIKTQSLKDTFGDNPIPSGTDSDMPEMIAQLLERKGNKRSSVLKTTFDSSIDKLNSLDKQACRTDGSIVQTTKKSNDTKLAVKSPHVKTKTLSNSHHKSPPEISPPKDPLFEELDDPLGKDDKEVRKLYRNKGFKKHTKNLKKNPSKMNPFVINAKQNVTKFPDKLKPQSLRMQKNSITPKEDVISELAKPGLHPSWQAKRIEKAKVVQLRKGPAPEVKRIVFDD